MPLHKKHPLPTWRDLPLEDGIPLEDDNHGTAARVYLIEPLKRYLAEHGIPAFVSGNSFVCYDPDDLKKGVVGPDVYVVNGGEQQGQGCWVVWAEGWKTPTCVIELVSPSTEASDREKKFLLYQNVLKVPDYFIYNFNTRKLVGFHLRDGVYAALQALPSGRLPCQSLPLQVGVVGPWVRWFKQDGSLLLTGDERADILVARVKELEEKLRTAPTPGDGRRTAPAGYVSAPKPPVDDLYPSSKPAPSRLRLLRFADGQRAVG